MVKIIFDPNRPDKRKSPEVEEATKPQSRKKTKASKGKNIVEDPTLTSEELNQSLTKSTEFLTKKWSKFAATHLDALTGVAQKITKLKDLVEQLATGDAASSTPVSVYQDTRQWPVRDNRGQVPSAALIITDAASRS